MMKAMIRRCSEADMENIWTIINDGAQAYKGIIPADRWTEPYMSRENSIAKLQTGSRSGDPKKIFNWPASWAFSRSKTYR